MKTFHEQISTIINTATTLHIANLNNTENYTIDSVYAVEIESWDDMSDDLFEEHELLFEEKVILMLALAPHLSPQALDIFLAKNPNFDSICSEFGGVTEKPHRGVIPTGETAVFILAARDLEKRKAITQLLAPDSKLVASSLISLETTSDEMPMLSGKLVPDYELVQLILFGEVKPPAMSPQFPAEQLTTEAERSDLILPSTTTSQLEDLKNWLEYQEELLEDSTLGKHAKKGYRTLFYGPPGTGKTLTASLLGKEADRPVFRIDLSLLVSKYIGETEKHLSAIFKKAENKKWILFFDEADALFSKRTETESSNDRFANQEVAYLLQRVENYNGMVILATNLKKSIDTAFLRRFQSLIHFEKPNVAERVLIWEQLIPSDLPLSEDINASLLSENYELTASQISNIVQSCFIQAKANEEEEISLVNLMKNMRLEFDKEGLLFEGLV